MRQSQILFFDTFVVVTGIFSIFDVVSVNIYVIVILIPTSFSFICLAVKAWQLLRFEDTELNKVCDMLN